MKKFFDFVFNCLANIGMVAEGFVTIFFLLIVIAFCLWVVFAPIYIAIMHITNGNYGGGAIILFVEFLVFCWLLHVGRGPDKYMRNSNELIRKTQD